MFLSIAKNSTGLQHVTFRRTLEFASLLPMHAVPIRSLQNSCESQFRISTATQYTLSSHRGFPNPHKQSISAHSQAGRRNLNNTNKQGAARHSTNSYDGKLSEIFDTCMGVLNLRTSHSPMPSVYCVLDTRSIAK